MKTNIYLKPLKKYLAEEISPKQLSNLFDELTFDYLQKIIELHLKNDDSDIYIHEETSSFLYHLKRLRDVLKKCTA